MIWNEKKYVILPIEDITQDMIDECLQTSLETLRKNIAETEAILKWYDRDESDPTSIMALDPAPNQYTNAEILVILNNPENGWIEEEEE